ncbi:MAG: adenosylcobinamide-GDP ribazoletransferase [Polyangiaceae bacterium]
MPVGSRPLSSRDQSWAPACFPVVGALLGLSSFAVFRSLSGLGDWGSAIVTTAFGAYVTGAFHEDGLADTCDALGGAVSRERALEIMKDSRIGSYGSVALLLDLMLRVALFVRIGVTNWPAFVLYACLSRLIPVWLMIRLPHAAPSQGKLKDLFQIPASRAVVATGLCVATSFGLAAASPEHGLRIALGWPIAALVALWFGHLGQRRLGGITGDLLGASEQIGELALLSVFAWH